MLKIFNTMTRKKEEFKPIYPGKVGVYVCGITMYDLCHIGHGRTFVAFDIVIRYLRYCGYDVNYIRNITDIENKIIHRAAKNKETIYELTERMISEMYIDFDQLNILRPNQEPRATHYINEIIELISQLLKKNHAYVGTNGDMMFAIGTYSDYGLLSRQNLKKLQSDAYIKTINVKRNPMDFVLWKIAKFGEPSWPSPWGDGRPGWHIECSAMNSRQLGYHFDIHGGGSDLLFPHHENEIAQSVCVHNGPYVNLWMHTGMVMVNNEKMSKSIGNFFTIRDVLRYYDAETVRYFLMSCHYRSQLNYSEDNLKQARSSLERLYIALNGTDKNAIPKGGEHFMAQFFAAMDDDFNTPKAYSILFDIAREVNRLKNEKSEEVHGISATLRHLAGILGLLEQDPISFLKKNIVKDHTIIEALIQQRNNARKARQWILADEIRDKLTKLGVVLEDNFHGTNWRRS
ncbi:Cysteine--tRNA ligase [Candidatus Gullanella endobia]|uniref:Cysteine--tRNA ligase n=1 Tax=Candidatus Gullanella endobia TaxID=1070130 RepID=A0A143WQ58_9ENTR|nr:cysteine--tRNA ligase [Candidatus Gullanella endobia]CUX95862.1 Cysteine--tRNA ligase [Candidatus Gullanella endobia]